MNKVVAIEVNGNRLNVVTEKTLFELSHFYKTIFNEEILIINHFEILTDEFNERIFSKVINNEIFSQAKISNQLRDITKISKSWKFVIDKKFINCQYCIPDFLSSNDNIVSIPIHVGHTISFDFRSGDFIDVVIERENGKEIYTINRSYTKKSLRNVVLCYLLVLFDKFYKKN